MALNIKCFSPAGKSTVELLPGNYNFSIYADGGLETGDVRLGNKSSALVLKLDKGIIKITNSYQANLYITLVGPRTYTFWAGPGISSKEVRQGSYTYSFSVDGNEVKGSLSVRKNGANLKLKPPKGGNCDKSYPTVCIPSPPPDLDCGDIKFRRFQVVGNDPHHFDGDHDGIGCEW